VRSAALQYVLKFPDNPQRHASAGDLAPYRSIPAILPATAYFLLPPGTPVRPVPGIVKSEIIKMIGSPLFKTSLAFSALSACVIPYPALSRARFNNIRFSR
jgi:hypothetical protein